MNYYYTQQADRIEPLYGVSDMEEAQSFAPGQTIIETTEEVNMNAATGSVDYEGGWDDLSDLVKVIFDPESEYWIEA
jgi:hypothetical protein